MTFFEKMQNTISQWKQKPKQLKASELAKLHKNIQRATKPGMDDIFIYAQMVFHPGLTIFLQQNMETAMNWCVQIQNLHGENVSGAFKRELVRDKLLSDGVSSEQPYWVQMLIESAVAILKGKEII